MNRVKELRIKAGMQQKELAIELGVQQPSVSRWEQQKADPTDENAVKMSEMFGVSVSYILCRDTTISDEEYQKAGRNTYEKVEIKPVETSEMSDIEYAMFGEIHELTDAEKQDILDYVRFKKQQRKV